MQTSLILGLLLHRVPSLTRPRGVPTLPRRHDNMQGSEWENYHVTCNTFESTRIIFLVNLHRLQTFWGKPDGCVIQIKLCAAERYSQIQILSGWRLLTVCGQSRKIQMTKASLLCWMTQTKNNLLLVLSRMGAMTYRENQEYTSIFSKPKNSLRIFACNPSSTRSQIV